MTFYFGESSKKNLIGVHPKLVDICNIAITISPQDFGVHDGLRTEAEQKEMYRRGASKLDGVKRKSKHQKQTDGFGHAVDLVPYLPRLGYRWEWSLIYPIAAVVGKVAQEMKVRLIWGGVWDLPMSAYGKEWTAEEMKKAVEQYTIRHPGPDFIDGPHFELG